MESAQPLTYTNIPPVHSAQCTLDAAVVKALQMLVAHIIAFRVQCLLIKTTADAAVQENGSVISIVLKVVPEFCVVQPGNLWFDDVNPLELIITTIVLLVSC